MDFYEVLGLKKGATESDIKKAYYKLARENHPDKVDADKREEATKNFQKIGEAYETLSDSEKRAIYDQYGKEGLSNSQNPVHNPFDLFSQMFGGMNFNQQFGQQFGEQNANNRRDRKNKRTVFPLKISLTDVYKGMEKKLKVTRKIVVNKTTKERINVKDYESTWKACEKCKGNGAVMEMRQMGNMITQTQKPCDKCLSRGYNFLPDFDLEEVSEILTVIIERGINNGSEIMFSNLGNASAGYLPGDLVVIVQTVDEEKGFIREHRNLIYKKEISLADALCGVNFILKTLDGRDIPIRYDDVITPNEKRIIPKEGILGANLIIVFDVIFPTKIKNKEKLRKLL
jgi:DnaJ family protein A protein 2